MRIRLMAALAALCGSTGCFAMHAVTFDDLSVQRTSRVWVTGADESTVLVYDAQVFRGKLVGFIDGKYRELPADALKEMRVRRLATARTIGVVAAGIAGFAAVAVLVSGGSADRDPCAHGLCDDEALYPYP